MNSEQMKPEHFDMRNWGWEIHEGGKKSQLIQISKLELVEIVTEKEHHITAIEFRRRVKLAKANNTHSLAVHLYTHRNNIPKAWEIDDGNVLVFTRTIWVDHLYSHVVPCITWMKHRKRWSFGFMSTGHSCFHKYRVVRRRFGE